MREGYARAPLWNHRSQLEKTDLRRDTVWLLISNTGRERSGCFPENEAGKQL
jgi:hypothetical protein